jgi:hypothetical protein
MSRVFKALGIAVGIAVALVLLLFMVLKSDWGGPSDALLAEARSPDKRFVAEIHRLATPMHGGPDRLYVSLGEVGTRAGFSDKIYERTYECDDLSAFRLRWATAHELTITYGDCDADSERSKGKYRDFYYQQQNRVWRSDTAWQGVQITYEDSKYVAKR